MTLDEIRKQQNLTQDELALKLDVNRANISKWESGEFIPNTKNLIRLASVLGVAEGEIIAAIMAAKNNFSQASPEPAQVI